MKQILWGWQECYSNLISWFNLVTITFDKDLYIWFWHHSIHTNFTYDSPWVLHKIFLKYYSQGTITQFIKWKAWLKYD
jgi:hypothetical protein